MKNGIAEMEKNAAKIQALIESRDLYLEQKAQLENFINSDHDIQVKIQCLGCGVGQELKFGVPQVYLSALQSSKTGYSFMFEQFKKNQASFDKFLQELADSINEPLEVLNKEIENLTN